MKELKNKYNRNVKELEKNYNRNVEELEKWFDNFVKNELTFYKIDVTKELNIPISDEFQNTTIVEIIKEENLETEFNDEDISEILAKTEKENKQNIKICDKEVTIFIAIAIIFFSILNFVI